MKDFFTMFWSETPHVWSSGRVLQVIGSLFIVFSFFGAWFYVSIIKKEMAPIPFSDIASISSIIGILITGKVINSKLSEKTGDEKPEEKKE